MSKWKAEGRYFDYGKEWWIVDELGHNVLGPIRCPHECFGPETLFQIVSEHNAHEALVASVEELINCIEGRLSEDCDMSAVRDARAALALAEGRE